MALTPPRLDDRGYADLRAELIRRIPVHSPEWTDYNPTDPGIALLELFAFLGDNLLYRLNRAPEASKLAFLQLLNIPPRPASVARVQVRVDLQKGAVDPVTPDFSPTAPRLQFAAGDVLFQATDEITVLPVELAGYVKRPYEGAAPPEGQASVEQLLKDHLGAAPALTAYKTTPLPAPKGGALPPSTSTAPSATVDGALWLALLAPAPVLKALDTGDPAATLDLVRRKIAGRVISLGVRTDDALCGPADALRCPDSDSSPARWPVRYDISTGGFSGAARRVDKIAYRRLAVEADDTDGLGRAGTLRLRIPEARGDGSMPFGDWRAGSFDIPDEDLLGVGGLPPRLDDPDLAARVLAWIRVRRIDDADPPIQVRLVDANMVMAEQAVTAPPEMLGAGQGRAGQTVSLSKTPVIQDSEVIQVRTEAGWAAWTRADDLALAGPDDPFYALDPTDGTVTFGDGVHGRMPLPGQAIRVLAYRYGGGAKGNVGAGGVSRVRGAPLRATNPLPAAGGQDAETEAQAQARIPKVLRARDRAVCADDFADIALETPGAMIGRAHVLARHKPFERADGIPGVVTLIVLPAQDLVTPDTPTPDREVLRKVCAWLEPRRLVTTELYVTPPEYVDVDIAIAVDAQAGVGEETLRRWVELALRQHFAPLPPYGPDGEGWPFGRAVRDRDAEAAALRVQGVAIVNEVVVQGVAVGPDGVRDAVSQTVPLQKWQLPVIRKVGVAIGPTAPSLDPDPDPPVGGVAVPVEQEEC
ncbi:hypothetical protein AS593_07305 [Caulobacter vibrioides]|nr:hypothetical protein AS593_07305 [Caulobacter vibrioides]